MSETKVATGKCKCGEDIERRETVWHHVTGYQKGSMWCYAEEGREGHAWPAEPVIEVAPGEPTCQYCGRPVHTKGWTHSTCEPQAVREAAPFTAVPAQEAPRVNCTCESPCHLDCTDSSCGCLHHARNKVIEPQAGARVPSQEQQLRIERISHAQTLEALAHIKSYAVEAAKTPITRESILAANWYDLKQIALTQYDEMQGLCRLILAESGGGK